MKKILITTIALLITGIILGFLASLFYLHSRLYPNVAVAGVEVGGLTKDEAYGKLEKTIEQKRKEQIELIFENNKWTLNLNQHLYQPQAQASVDNAYNRRSIVRLLNRAHISLPLEYDLDQSRLETTVATIAAQLSFPTQEPQFEVASGKVEISPGQNGQELDELETASRIKDNLGRLDFAAIRLPVERIEVAITAAQMESTRRRAESLLEKRLTIVVNEQSSTLGGEEILQLLDFADGFNPEKIASYTATLAERYNRPPQNAQFQMQDNRVVLFKPAKEGITVNEELTVEQITDGLNLLEVQEKKTHTVSLTLQKSAPEIANKDVNSLGIAELLGRGVSYFTGSAAGRIHNLSLSAERINGLLVPPGEVFSFNNAVGEISAETGYQSAYIIKQGRTILDDGGGVCQDSTTLFRAVLDAGLPVVERRAHAYRVVYYEKGGYKAGLDATVYAPSVDLKFKNDTPAHLLIQTYANRAANRLTYEIYGTADGRAAKITNHRVWDQQPPPEPLYQDDPTLPAGTVKQIDFAAWGAKAAFDYTVTRSGETLTNHTFHSSFRPWQAVYLRGTGG